MIPWCASFTLRSLPIFLTVAFLSWSPSAGAGEPEATIELQCQINSRFLERRPRTYQVEVLKFTGERLRSQMGFAGSNVRFKSLKPAIYVLCILGDMGRKHCESVDLTPPPGHQSHRFVRQLDEPLRELNRSDANRISAARLTIPKAALQAMARASNAQLRGDSKGAFEYLQRAIAIYPQYADALNNLGTYYHRALKYDLAVNEFTKVTMIAPDSYLGWTNLGGTLLSIGQFERALQASAKAFELRPDDPHVVFQLGMNYFYLRNFAEAKRYFEKTLEIDPETASLPHIFLAHIALTEKNETEAGRYIRDFLALHPYAPEAERMRNMLKGITRKDLEMAGVRQTPLP